MPSAFYIDMHALYVLQTSCTAPSLEIYSIEPLIAVDESCIVLLACNLLILPPFYFSPEEQCPDCKASMHDKIGMAMIGTGPGRHSQTLTGRELPGIRAQTVARHFRP